MSSKIEVSREKLDLILTYGCETTEASDAWNSLRTELDAPVVERQPSCPKCNDTGEVDSGGIQPWSEGINIACDCRATPVVERQPDHPPHPHGYTQNLVREEFEEWAAKEAEIRGIGETIGLMLDEHHDRYSMIWTQTAWMAWQASRSELQATIAQLRQHKNDYMEAAEEARKALTAEIERLKAGQGEPVRYECWYQGAWLQVQPVDVADREKEGWKIRKLYASQPTPTSSELVRLLTRARIYARGEFRDEIDACLSGQPAPVSVVLPESVETIFDEQNIKQKRKGLDPLTMQQKLLIGIGFMACIDKVKELNQ